MSKKVEVSSQPKAMIDTIGLNVPLATAEAFNPTSGHASEALFACIVVWDMHLTKSNYASTADILYIIVQNRIQHSPQSQYCLHDDTKYSHSWFQSSFISYITNCGTCRPTFLPSSTSRCPPFNLRVHWQSTSSFNYSRIPSSNYESRRYCQPGNSCTQKCPCMKWDDKEIQQTPPCSILCGRTICHCKYSRLDRAATDNKRILCRIVDIADSKEQPGYKLRCLYGLLKGLHLTSALAAVSTTIQQSQGNPISINKTGNEIALAHAASQASTSSKVGVSYNCKKGCGT